MPPKTKPGRGNGSSSTRAARLSPEPRLAPLGAEVQRFGTTRLLPIALAKNARADSCRLLNEILADSMILYALYKKHHWLVAGPTFYQLHLLFDKHAEEQTELIDLLAERVQSLGGIAVGDPRHAAELTTIDRPPNGAEDVPAMIHRLLDAHETIIEKVRKAIDKTEKSEDWGSNDLLMSDVLRVTLDGPASRGVSPEPQLAPLGVEIQRFGTTRLLPIALAKEARSDSCRLLNEILADSMVLYALYKKHHWLVGGPTFYQLHLLFDKHAEEQTEIIDLIAERVQSLGGISVGDPRHAAELTTIDRPPNGAEDVPAMIHRLLNAHETIIEKVRAAIDKTEKAKDWGTNDMLMGDVLRRHELQVWFIAQHVVDEPLIER